MLFFILNYKPPLMLVGSKRVSDLISPDVSMNLAILHSILHIVALFCKDKVVTPLFITEGTAK